MKQFNRLNAKQAAELAGVNNRVEKLLDQVISLIAMDSMQGKRELNYFVADCDVTYAGDLVEELKLLDYITQLDTNNGVVIRIKW